MSIRSEIEQQVRQRLEELRPAYEEYLQLQDVLAAFEGARRGTSSQAPQAPTRRRSPRTSRSSAGGRRTEQALALVSDKPGVTVSQLAEELGTGPTYLYRIMPALEKEGRVRKEGKGYFPV